MALDEKIHRALDGLIELRVPLRFEDYMRGLNAELLPEPGRCDCCGDTTGVWSFPHRNSLSAEKGECEQLCGRCAGYDYGFDQAQERTARFILTAALSAALAADVPLSVVRLAVEDAIDSHVHGNGVTQGRGRT